MPSTREYLDFVLEQLSDLDGIAYRKMMGEYILYYRGRIVGGIYDNRLLVKPVAPALAPMERGGAVEALKAINGFKNPISYSDRKSVV